MSNQNDFVIENGVLKNYLGSGGDVVVPDGVIEIAANAFNRLAPGNNVDATIQSIRLPASLRIIGPNAFCWSGFTQLVIPDGVTKISYKAFNLCSRLSKLTIPNSVFDIGSEALKDTPWMKSHSKEPLVYVGKVLLLCQQDQTEVTVEPGTVGIAGDAFSDCREIRIIIIPESVKCIGNRAFANCNKLECVTISGNPSIGKDCFPAGVAIIAPDLTINTVKGTLLKKQLFLGTVIQRESAVDPGAKKYLAKHFSEFAEEFKNRPGFLEGAIEKELLSAEQAEALLDRFSGDASKCAVLLAYIQKKNAKAFNHETQDLFRKPTVAELRKLWETHTLDDGSLELTGYKGTEKEITIPAYIGKTPVTRIGVKCFAAGGGIFSSASILAGKAYGMDETKLLIQIVSMQNGIRVIDEYALCDCVNLNFVTFSETLEFIGDYAFNNCCRLTTIAFPNTLKRLGACAFKGCSGLIELSLPEQFAEVGDYAFWGCEHLTIISLPASVTRIGNECFHDCHYLTIHAPAGSYAEQYAKEHNIPFVAD